MKLLDIQAEMRSVWSRMQELQDYYKALTELEVRASREQEAEDNDENHTS